MKRYYDFNVYSESKISEKLHYMHQNPVARGLVEHPEEWSGAVLGLTRVGIAELLN